MSHVIRGGVTLNWVSRWCTLLYEVHVSGNYVYTVKRLPVNFGRQHFVNQMLMFQHNYMYDHNSLQAVGYSSLWRCRWHTWMYNFWVCLGPLCTQVCKGSFACCLMQLGDARVHLRGQSALHLKLWWRWDDAKATAALQLAYLCLNYSLQSTDALAQCS